MLTVKTDQTVQLHRFSCVFSGYILFSVTNYSGNVKVHAYFITHILLAASMKCQ